MSPTLVTRVNWHVDCCLVDRLVEVGSWYVDNSSKRSSFFQHADCVHVTALDLTCCVSFQQCFICSLTFCTFSVDLNKRENRLQLTFILLLTTVTFKFAVNSSLPRISYLTTLVNYWWYYCRNMLQFILFQKKFNISEITLIYIPAKRILTDAILKLQ
jgi:hypothetical protein